MEKEKEILLHDFHLLYSKYPCFLEFNFSLCQISLIKKLIEKGN